MKKRCILNRKGYFFLIDSIIALGVLTIGVFLVLNLYTNVPSKDEQSILSEDIMSFFAGNKIKDTNNLYAGLGGTLWQQGKITNAENSLLQQIAEFYSNGDLDTAETFIIQLIENILPTEYKLEFWIHDSDFDTLIYPKNPSQQHLRSKEATKILIPSRKVVYGISMETGDMFGPYNAEVLVWR